MNRSPILLLFIFFITCTKPAQSKIVCNDKGYLEAIPLPLYKCENSVVTRQEYNTQVAQDYIANTRRGARQRAAAALAALNAKETWTFGITSQAMTQKMGSTVSQNEWTFAIASQTMAEAQNVVVYQNQWTLAIDAQAITENVGVAVTQGSVSGTLHTALQNEWTLAIDAQAITANSGITVTQGSVTGTLKTALTGATTSIVIQTVAGVSFVTTADVVIGTSSTATRTTIKLSNIKTARNSGTTTKVIVTAATGVTFVTTSNVMIGSTTILASNIRTATNSLYVTGTLKTALNINSATTTILVQGSISNFVATADLVVGSTTIANTDIKTATNSQSAQGTLQTALVHEWLLDITAQGITEQTGVAVTQGANAGTLKTKLVNEWTLSIVSQTISASAGVTVTQGSKTGTLKTSLNGATTKILIETVSGVLFLTNENVVIGSTTGSSTTIASSNINSVLNNGATTKIIIQSLPAVSFTATNNIVIGSTTILAGNIITACNNEWTMGIIAQAITENAGVTVTQGTKVGTLKTKLLNEWNVEIAAQTITEDVGVTVTQNEWTLEITAQAITESVGVAVTQGLVTGTLRTALSNEWTLVLLNAPVITETAGVTVTQGASTGTLKTNLTEGVTSVIIETASGVTFVNNADVTIGTTAVVHANIETAVNNGATTTVVIETASGVTFLNNADIMIGSTQVVLINIDTATKSVSATGTLKTELTGADMTNVVIETMSGIIFVNDATLVIGSSSVLVDNVNKVIHSGATKKIIIQAVAGINFVTTADLVIGSTTVLLANIQTASNIGTATQIIVTTEQDVTFVTTTDVIISDALNALDALDATATTTKILNSNINQVSKFQLPIPSNATNGTSTGTSTGSSGASNAGDANRCKLTYVLQTLCVCRHDWMGRNCTEARPITCELTGPKPISCAPESILQELHYDSALADLNGDTKPCNFYDLKTMAELNTVYDLNIQCAFLNPKPRTCNNTVYDTIDIASKTCLEDRFTYWYDNEKITSADMFVMSNNPNARIRIVFYDMLTLDYIGPNVSTIVLSGLQLNSQLLTSVTEGTKKKGFTLQIPKGLSFINNKNVKLIGGKLEGEFQFTSYYQPLNRFGLSLRPAGSLPFVVNSIGITYHVADYKEPMVADSNGMVVLIVGVVLLLLISISIGVVYKMLMKKSGKGKSIKVKTQ